MSKVYGYCRVALANEEEMVDQIRLVEDYCRDHDLIIEKCFCDNGVSGLLLDRKGLNGLLEVLQNGDVIVVRDIARLSRSYLHCVSLLEQVRDLDITLTIIE
jgi:DNA invertase Pin-like site-specific DNA recombinase